MGAFWTESMSIAGHLGELVGYKAGLALTREELAEHLSDTPDIRGRHPCGRGPMGTFAI